MRLDNAPPQAHLTQADPVPSFVFNPSDPWTATFQTGLERAGLNGRRVYEVGIGSGANVLFMLRDCGAAVVYGSDLDPRLAAVARSLVAEFAPALVDRFLPIEGAVNLVDAPAAQVGMASADIVVGCLPQVPDPVEAGSVAFRIAQLVPLDDGRVLDDHLAHYYSWEAFDDYPFNVVGLGLIEALLAKAAACAPQAQVVLNLGCRIGKEVLRRLFRANGYDVEELASRIVPQDARTDISFFVALEAAVRGTGYEQDFACEFYADPAGTARISAREAKERLYAVDPQPVYHEVCVLRGSRMAEGARN